jgi:hypothetical protein
MLVRNECDELRGERDKEGERFFAPTGNPGCGRVSTDRFRPKGLKEKRRDRWSWQNTAWRSLATICSNTFPHKKIRHGAALPPCRDGAWWQIYNLSEVDVFWGDPFSTDRFRPDGLKERAKGIRGRKIFRPYGKSGVWTRFLPIDSIPTDRFRPKGLKEKRRDRWSWQITAWRSLATICRNTSPHKKIRHGAALPPCCDMGVGGRWTTSPRLKFLSGVWRFLPDDSCRWHERKEGGRTPPLREIRGVDAFSTDRFRPKGLKEKRAKDFSPLRGKSVGWTCFLLLLFYIVFYLSPL